MSLEDDECPYPQMPAGQAVQETISYRGTKMVVRGGPVERGISQQQVGLSEKQLAQLRLRCGRREGITQADKLARKDLGRIVAFEGLCLNCERDVIIRGKRQTV